MTFEFTLFMIFSLYPLVFLLGEKGWDNTIERYLSFKSILPTEYFVPRFLWTTFISAILIYSAPSMWANNYEYQDYITGYEYVHSLPEKRQRQIFSILTKQQAHLTSRYGVTNTQEKVDAAAVLQEKNIKYNIFHLSPLHPQIYFEDHFFIARNIRIIIFLLFAPIYISLFVRFIRFIGW